MVRAEETHSLLDQGKPRSSQILKMKLSVASGTSEKEVLRGRFENESYILHFADHKDFRYLMSCLNEFFSLPKTVTSTQLRKKRLLRFGNFWASYRFLRKAL